MIKLVDLLNEIDIPKNKWVTIPASELKDYSEEIFKLIDNCLLYTSPSPRDRQKSRMPSSA